jgi:lactoylglutathione lyase
MIRTRVSIWGVRLNSTKKEEERAMFRRIIASVLFVKDLAACTTFYRDTLGLPVIESDSNGVTIQMENVYFILLEVSAAASLIGKPGHDLTPMGGPRGLLAASVENVDAVYAALSAKGVTFLVQPTNQSWGLRTAHFADPEGNIWEINQPIAAQPAE